MHCHLNAYAGETVKFVRLISAIATCVLAGAVGGCAPHSDASSHRLSIVATTGILADFARNVGGDYVDVHQLIPNGADPHSWELSLRGIRDIAYADIAVTNYLMLEDHSVIRALDANLPKDALSLSLAEESAKFGGTLIPLVEDRSLDTPWLGMRVYGDGSQIGAKRSSQVELSVAGIEGPGQACAYITTSFGSPEIAFASRDGFDGGNHWETDTSILPVGAHQHMSWVFTQPGIYTLHLRARVRVTPDAEPIELPPSHVTFAVGIDSEEVARERGLFLLRRGHSDVTVDLKSGALTLMVDREKDGGVPEGAPLRENAEESNGLPSTLASLNIERVLIDVPSRTLREIPKGLSARVTARPMSCPRLCLANMSTATLIHMRGMTFITRRPMCELLRMHYQRATRSIVRNTQPMPRPISRNSMRLTVRFRRRSRALIRSIES